MARFLGISGKINRVCFSTSSIIQTITKPSVLLVNHGYPPLFNAGSEVYTQTLAVRLNRSRKTSAVSIIAREQNPFRDDFIIRQTQDEHDSTIPIFLINHAREAPYQRFVNTDIDHCFKNLCQNLYPKPNIVHFGHLNHLSLTLPQSAKDILNAKVIYTLHDYWLMCPRGQFLINGVASTFINQKPYELCTGQEDKKCASKCFTSRFATGTTINKDREMDYWTWWINERMHTVRQACDTIDMFIAPSLHLQKRFIDEFGLPPEKVKYLPYGFDRSILSNRRRIRSLNDPLVFGYIGRHAPSKGINLLLEAAQQIVQTHPDLINRFSIVIYGRPDSTTTNYLQTMAKIAGILIEWRSEYKNSEIVERVFNQVDYIVVPSIWDENSPLVIHEAQQCRVPVITADHGGMSELVKDGVNGLIFTHRNVSSLAQVILQAIQQPDLLDKLSQHGYLYSNDKQVPSIESHVDQLIDLYSTLTKNHVEEQVNHLQPKPIESLSAPRRITFDTNPDDCNFSCIMCEQHSEHSPHQKARKEAKIRRRRMDFDIIKQVVAETASLGLQEIIPSTMGEPLMYRDAKGRTFEDIIKLCRDYNIKLNLTTNGSFFSPQGHSVTEWAHLLMPVLSDIKFSWNGSTKTTQELVMKNSKLDKQLKNLTEFIRIRDEYTDKGDNRVSITLQLTFMEINLPEIPEIVKLGISLGVDRIKGHHLWAHFKQIKDQNLRRSPESIHRWNQCVIECQNIARQYLLPTGKQIKLENFFELNEQSGPFTIHPQSVCPFLGKEAWINHSGRFDPCCAPDQERLSLGSFGNVQNSNETLMKIWTSDAYKNLINNYTKYSLCQNCNMRKPPELK
ncbi:unnamed protein product [Rotaria sordida]|uniref:Glycosyltransferase n=1 Tax=Rotaria sordida TaxID=392033 RepID=A0A815ZV09_9BILA|nr:unnamed protein product [Rotaria sordida]CAF1589434.1 unnamed protein product [Rotaria sordida]